MVTCALTTALTATRFLGERAASIEGDPARPNWR